MRGDKDEFEARGEVRDELDHAPAPETGRQERLLFAQCRDELVRRPELAEHCFARTGDVEVVVGHRDDALQRCWRSPKK